MTTKQDAWDSPENEANNSFVSWGKIGDFVLGTLIGKKKVKSTLPGKEGTFQDIYEMKVKEGAYYTLNDDKKIVEPRIVLKENDIISIGGRSTIDSRMVRVSIGQTFGLKYVETQPAKTKGYSPTKVIKVFTPKNEKNEYVMDQEWLDSQKDEMDAFVDK